jgi:hypothetical protein
MSEHMFDHAGIDHAGIDRSVLVAPAALARPTLPVVGALTALFPHGGLVRGTSVAVSGGPGSTSLALAAVAAASQAGSWVAVVGVGDLGLGAMGWTGVAHDRVLLVDAPGADLWPRVMAVLAGSVDVVVAGPPATGGRRPPGAVPPRVGRRLGTVVREQSAVVLTVGWEIPGFEPQVRLAVTAEHWDGLGGGHGHLRSRRVAVTRTGRGSAGRLGTHWLWLPSCDGTVLPADPPSSTATVLAWPAGGR